VRSLNLSFILLAIVLFLPKNEIQSQDPAYTHYTVESGLQLPSNEVYGIVFDKNQVLWATTDRGIWRYDGNSARQFTVNDGLRENTNFRIFADKKGRIWISSINNYLYQIIDDTVRMHPASRRIHELGKSSGFIQQVVERPDGSINLCFNRLGLYHFQGDNPPELMEKHRVDHTDASVAIHYSPDEYYWDMINLKDTVMDRKSTTSTDNGWIYLQCGTLDPRNNYRKDLCPIGPDEFLFSYSKRAFHIKSGNIISEHLFPNDVIAVYADQKGNFWVGLENEGVLRFPKRDLESIPVRYLGSESVTGISQDHEGNYWFSTSSNGIFQANTLDISVNRIDSNKEKDNVITAMVADERNFYIGTQTGLLFKGTQLENLNCRLTEIKMPENDGPIRKLFLDSEKHLFVLCNSLMVIDTLGRYRGVGRIKGYPYDCIIQPEGGWLASFTDLIVVGKYDEIIRRWDPESFRKAFTTQMDLVQALNRVRCMFQDSNGRFWMGSQNSGLFSSEDRILYQWIKEDSIFGRRIRDIDQAGKNIWVSIADYGIAVIRPDSSFFRITQKEGLSSDIIDVLYPENDSVVWAGTNNGLNRISLKPGSQTADFIAYYTSAEGLPSNRIYQITRYKGNIMIATTQGVIRLKDDFTKPPDISPKLVIRSVVVNDRLLKPDPYMILDPDENNLVFNFQAITYRKPSRLTYQYRLIGVDKEPIVTHNLESRYPDLRYGVYTFCVNASYSGTFDPATEKKITVQIQRHWFETRAFLIAGCLLLIALIHYIFRIVLRATKKRELEKQQLLQAEKRSLLSQMNPHFIFNSLNSIQHFVVQHDEVQANNYLTNFSGLIRRILDNSKKNLIPLNEEITTLNLYLGMEKLRFESEFEFKILKDKNIDYNETMIPPMMLQPFVENAIWHGLLPMKTMGILQISFTGGDDYLHCTIEDNGIGREKALSLKKKKSSHVSSGILNVQERIELLNKLNKKKISLTITDLRHPNGAASGTRVELLLPFDLKL
jgi:hypothetical protein